MAVWTYPTERSTRAGAAPGIARQMARLRDAWERYKVYRGTLTELSQLSDRDLADIGIMRCDIHMIAKEAADGEATPR